jgi:hypothetical protein
VTVVIPLIIVAILASPFILFYLVKAARLGYLRANQSFEKYNQDKHHAKR